MAGASVRRVQQMVQQAKATFSRSRTDKMYSQDVEKLITIVSESTYTLKLSVLNLVCCIDSLSPKRPCFIGCVVISRLLILCISKPFVSLASC